METITDKILQAIISNIENVFENVLVQIKKLPEEIKTDNAWIFLRHLIYLIEHSMSRIKVTPIEEKIRKNHYWKLWHENEETRKKLIELTAFIEKQRQFHETTADQIHSHYMKNYQLVELIQNKFLEDAEAIRLRFERMQINEYKHFEERKHDLTEICGISENKLQNLKSNSEKLEADLFSKRLKISTKYLSLLNRYDTEIGDRERSIVKLKTELENLMVQNRQLDEKLKEQSPSYDSCFHEQEEAKLSLIKSKLNTITRIIAAKKIQRWWRSIIPTRKTRSKKTKKKGKKSRKK